MSWPSPWWRWADLRLPQSLAREAQLVAIREANPDKRGQVVNRANLPQVVKLGKRGQVVNRANLPQVVKLGKLEQVVRPDKPGPVGKLAAGAGQQQAATRRQRPRMCARTSPFPHL